MFVAFVLFACASIASCLAAPAVNVVVRNETILTTYNTTAQPLERHRRQATLDSETMRAILLNAVPGVDYPAFDKPIPTGFQCSPAQGVLAKGGYYADMEAGCAMFHICANGYDYPMMCPKQTLFNQRTLTCDWFFEVNCPSARELYAISNQDVFTFAQPTPTFYPSGVQQPIVYQQNLQPPLSIPQQQFADALPSTLSSAATRTSDATSGQQVCCAAQQQPSGMLVLHDQAPLQNAASPPHAIVVLFVPMTAQSDNYVNMVQPAEQIQSQPMADALQSANVLQKKEEDCVKTTDNTAAAANTLPLQQDAIQQQRPIVQQQIPAQRLIQQQPNAQTSEFIRSHQLKRNNRPLSDFDTQRTTTQQARQDFVQPVQQQQPVQLREATHFASDSISTKKQQQQQKLQSDFTPSAQTTAQTQQQVPAIQQQQQQIPIQQPIPQQQQQMLPQQIGGGLPMGNVLAGQPGALLNSMLSGISQPGGVFAVLGQLMNTGPQTISNVLPIGTQMQTLIVPQVLGDAREQPALAVVNNCCQV